MWEHRGITGSGNPLSAIGSRKGAVLVIGGAACVWDDLQRIPHGYFDKMVVNDVGMYIEWPINHWVSMHANYLQTWMRLRRWHALSLDDKFESHTQKSAEGITNAWQIDNVFAYSGMFAVQIAIALGYEKILLAGIPQDGQRRFFDPPWYKQNHADSNASIAQGASLNSEIMRCTRSMSGWTQKFFGSPEEKPWT